MGESRKGVCRLSGEDGNFIDCHIIPEALSETLWKGEPLTQKDRNGRLIRRWTSWYDKKLVTQKGEDILAEYDDWAIKFFRERKLVWRSWGPMQILSSSYHDVFPLTGSGVRKLDNVDGRRLRLFFLSILWRAAATSLWEFEDINLPTEDFNRLTVMVRSGEAEPFDFLPISLIQLSTQTIPFNHTVLRKIKKLPTLDADGQPNFVQTREVKYFRIYFDGLIANLDIGISRSQYEGSKMTYVNDGPSLSLLTMPAGRSAPIAYLNYERGLQTSPDCIRAVIEADTRDPS